MTREELNKTLEEHKLWVEQRGGKRAHLSGFDLREANFIGAMLYNADLEDADLRGARFEGADLRCANLQYADLRGAVMECANLQNAFLREAMMEEVSLRRADLGGADITHANFRYADLAGAKNVPYMPMACPSEGAFIGWKKVHGYLVKLMIPEGAKRSSATSTKCRCDKALVLDIEDGLREIINHKYTPCTYTVGEMVYADSWDRDRWNECSHGIHFFIDKQEAINY